MGRVEMKGCNNIRILVLNKIVQGNNSLTQQTTGKFNVYSPCFYKWSYIFHQELVRRLSPLGPKSFNSSYGHKAQRIRTGPIFLPINTVVFLVQLNKVTSKLNQHLKKKYMTLVSHSNAIVSKIRKLKHFWANFKIYQFRDLVIFKYIILRL